MLIDSDGMDGVILELELIGPPWQHMASLTLVNIGLN